MTIAEWFGLKAAINCMRSKLDLAIEQSNISLNLRLDLDIFDIDTLTTQAALAGCHEMKGELNIALELNNKVLAQIPKVEYYFPMRFMAMIQTGIGNIYYQKQDLDTALKNYKNSLDI